MTSRATRMSARISAVTAAAAMVVGPAGSARLGPASRPPAWASMGYIVFRCGDSLCLVRPDGTATRRLLPATTPRPWPQWDPAVSADGRWIAFRGYFAPGDGEYALYVVRADGCGLHRVTSSIAGNPSWSPNGRWIAFDTSGAGEVWKVHPTGKGLTRIAGSNAIQASSPAWSPDGTRIAFVRGRALWTADPDGARAHLVHADAGLSDHVPAWSHDSVTLSYAAQTWRTSAIATVHADGTTAHRLTRGREIATNPVWLPGDAGIAYVRLAGASGSLAVMRRDGRAVTVLPTPAMDQFAWAGASLPPRRC